jgi:TolA-binding protein
LEQKQYVRAAAVIEPMLAYKLPAEEELEVRYLLAASEEGMRKYDQALRTLEPVIESASEHLKADALLLRGSILLSMRRFADAIVPLEKYMRGNPVGDGVVQAAGQLAICYARCKQVGKAKKIYADLREKYPKHPLLAPATEQLAEAAFDADDAAWSAELSSILIELGKQKASEMQAASKAPGAPVPESTTYEIKGLAGLGWSQYKSGQLTEAAATFDRVLQMQPSDDLAAEVVYARGQVLEKLEQFDSALALYDLAIEKYPKAIQHPDAMYAAARLRMKLQQNREAAALYEKLAAAYPQYAKLDAAIYDWAWTLRELDKAAEADTLYQRLRKEFPKSRYWTDAVYRLAQRAFEAQKTEQANNLLDELFAAKPEPALSEYGLYLRAQVALQGKDWSKTRQAFERLLEEFPECRERMQAEFWIAESDYREKKIDESDKRFEEIAKRIPGRQEPWMAMIALRRAQIALYRKNWDDAYKFASSIEKDFPDFGQQYEANLVLGRCLANRAEFEEARNAYGKVIRSATGAKTETAAMAQWLIGETYFHQKNYESALREYLKVDILYAYPEWQSLALLEAAKCHEFSNDFKQAKQCYQRILDRYSTTPSAKEAKQRIEEIKKEEKSQDEGNELG